MTISMKDGPPLFNPLRYSAGFTLDLYCDRVHFDGLDNSASFAGKNFTDCAHQAKAAGWRMRADSRTATCPRHITNSPRLGGKEGDK